MSRSLKDELEPLRVPDAEAELPSTCLCLRLLARAEDEAELEGLLAAAGHEVFEVRTGGAKAEYLVYGSQTELSGLRALAERKWNVVEQVECTLVGDGWKTHWVEHLEPTQLTATVRVSAEGPHSKPGDLVLTRALAFGYGEHSTTRLAALWLEARCRAAHSPQVLDVGCGTGVLCLLAALAGATAVGVDIAPEAIASSRQNAARNGLEDRCRFLQGSLEQIPSQTQFEVVIANIEAGALCALAPAVAAVCSESTVLGLTGLLIEQSATVCSAYERVGVHLSPVAQEGPWQLLAAGATKPGQTVTSCAFSERRSRPGRAG